MLVLRPAPPPPDWAADTQGVMGGSDHGRDVGVVIREAEEDKSIEVLTEEVRLVLVFCVCFSAPPLYCARSLTVHLPSHPPRRSCGANAQRRSSGR